MKVVQISQGCELELGGRLVHKFEQDKFYIMSDITLSRLNHIIPGLISMEIPFREIYNKYGGQNLDGKKLLLLRHGGGGDILFMSTGATELKRRFPGAIIDVAIGEQYIPIIKNSPTINKVFSPPICLDDWNNYHYHLIFEDLVEKSAEAREFNAYDLFMKEMGLDIEKVPAENKIPEIHLQSSEIERVRNTISSLQNHSPKIGIQAASSTIIRDYPPYSYQEIALGLIEKGYEVYFFGSGRQEMLITSMVKSIGRGSYNASSNDLRDSIILASFMGCFIAPDSMFVHIAGALSIPVIGIYGPFLSEFRMKYFKNAVGIDGRTACSPCFLHGSFPCPKGNPSPCLALITPDVVLQVFEELIEGRLWHKR